MVTRIDVQAEHAYPVFIGRGLLGEVPELIDGAERVAIIHPASLTMTAEAIRDDLAATHTVTLIEVPDAEDAKSAAVLEFCWNALGSSGFTRSDVIIGVGGGATTDLAGFVAATWLRGVRVVHIPTTILGMVDAAVGGKTGINTAAGKNLVGAFHSPVGVLCDLTALETLPSNDLRAGMAEVIKVGLTSDPSIVTDIIGRPEAAVDPMGTLLPDLMRRAVQIKADVVGADFREVASMEGNLGREVLNYGHTFGHAVELVERYRWRHGAAVSIGLMYVANLAHLAGRLDRAQVERHRQVLSSLELPTTYKAGQWPALYEAMTLDKKARGSLLRFVIMTDAGQPSILAGPDPAMLVAAYDAVTA
jgi:3-dehydroquinate synthase